MQYFSKFNRSSPSYFIVFVHLDGFQGCPLSARRSCRYGIINRIHEKRTQNRASKWSLRLSWDKVATMFYHCSQTEKKVNVSVFNTWATRFSQLGQDVIQRVPSCLTFWYQCQQPSTLGFQSLAANESVSVLCGQIFMI